ncbi:hypothetical protein [Pseudoalteromonas sp. JSTW]|uniref:hypothetical protein n=1 Tax=Pseudoalteromonas sp. JSTW TaxID=2752475 RepID=UPI0015D52B2F|nr:hypothetical protein [Pseudoalteromonas sp. JSTW]QLJ10127.1 hypothetical protein GZH31_19065 [Pseudoalteromonas sp. JSTW]
MAIIRRRGSSSNAILVLESPWGLDENDNNRSSVVPFMQGIAKFTGDTEVFHANFYDKKSFDFALDCITREGFKNTIIYVAAHGYKNKIGNVNVDHILAEVSSISKKQNITGLLFGSCFIGKKTIEMEVYIQESGLRWCMGYASSCNWLEGTMIDAAIIAAMISLDNVDFESRDEINSSFANAIAPFAENFIIGDDYPEKPISIRDSLKFVCQPEGKGYRAKEVTDEVFEIAKELRFDN